MASNPAQAKEAIDSGRTGDKVPGFDPAAAPLGADDEAGGARPGPSALAQETSRERRAPNAAHPPLAPNADKPPSPVAMPVLIGVAAALMLGAVLLWLLVA